jgi:hypothetical protein
MIGDNMSNGDHLKAMVRRFYWLADKCRPIWELNSPVMREMRTMVWAVKKLRETLGSTSADRDIDQMLDEWEEIKTEAKDAEAKKSSGDDGRSELRREYR